MKNRSGAVIFAVFFGILFLLGSCADLFNPPGEPGPAVGKVRLSILLEDASRTALPQGRFDKYVLRFHYEGEGGYTHEDLEGTSGFSVDLEPGVWTISADAYAGAVLSGTGRVTVTVGAGLTAPVTIRIEVMETAGMPGTLSYTVSYPAAGSDHAYGSQTLTVFDISNDTVVASKTIRSGVPGSSELAPGVYLVTAIINDTVQRTQAQRTVAAHIYAGQETVLEIDIGGEEFTAAIPLTGTIGAAGGPPADSRVIRVYADAGCTSLVGVSGELDDEGRFVVWVPSKDIPPDGGTVYMRQEITVNGVTTTGTAQSVIIAENQEEPPVINWEAEGGDLFYAVAVDGGISGGTVSASLEAAFPGTLVTLTAVPLHEAAALKPGTVKVNGGGATLTGSGPYTFTMPAGDVTVTAEFFNGRRYVRETAAGTGDGSSWANASDDLQKMMDEAAEAEAAQGLEALVRVAAGTYKPRY
ncbi:MAG: hypothetical protein LBQ55_01845, partial [Treponema sp.]|nr:hypothetical protein [Treponema sp.]